MKTWTYDEITSSLESQMNSLKSRNKGAAFQLYLAWAALTYGIDDPQVIADKERLERLVEAPATKRPAKN
ncbi:hypothetical protein B0G84_8549 [Paraburkholderia sp. BL8N3]|nr:hypothetical protein [Paraburkholderia sp. BL8N3]TCK32698.1 hypothetical protein B0G84_8549 [Paraburkholderia sp. BL8N3]